jgi:hypothetical protein
MSDPSPSSRPPVEVPRNYSLLAGFLSYLVPGLGQISQGRIGKGLLFMVCLLGMFYYGMDLGSWSNVYLPDTFREDRMQLLPVGRRMAASLVDRLPFAGQFWIGISAWPAIAQYNHLWPIGERSGPFWHNYQRERSEDTVNDLQRNSDKGAWDLGLVCTVIAGVLNILVIYDAYAGPAFSGEAEPKPARREEETAAA